MKFTLTYDGPLESAGNKPKKNEKWAIRKQFDPQLRKLWELNLDLANLKANSIVRADGQYVTTWPHHTAIASMTETRPVSHLFNPPAPPMEVIETERGPAHMIDLCGAVQVGGRSFLPLVRDSLALTCGLTIQFLRQESRGRVYQGGDLDGRLKLLLDALSVPQDKNELVDDAEIAAPIYCLVENDKLVTGLDVQTEQLLSAPNNDEKFVRLVVGVDVRISRPRPYNAIFNGS